jgi:hypothetical protein
MEGQRVSVSPEKVIIHCSRFGAVSHSDHIPTWNFGHETYAVVIAWGAERRLAIPGTSPDTISSLRLPVLGSAKLRDAAGSFKFKSKLQVFEYQAHVRQARSRRI